MQIVCFHNPNEENGYLSNWYLSPFTVNGIDFSSMEQYMMYAKAICFGDQDIADRILGTDDVAEIKALGRMVKNYDDHFWSGVRQISVYEGLYAKFSQNSELKNILLKTGSESIVENTSSDYYWGCGTNGSGKNMLGIILMEIRDKLKCS